MQEGATVLVMIGAAAHPDKRTEFTQTALSLLEQIRESRGCLSCSVYQKCEDQNVFCLVQEWASQEDFENHMRTDTFAVLQGAMQILLKVPPELRVNEIGERILDAFPQNVN